MQLLPTVALRGCVAVVRQDDHGCVVYTSKAPFYGQNNAVSRKKRGKNLQAFIGILSPLDSQ